VKITFQQTYDLRPEQIDDTADQLEGFLKEKYALQGKEIIRLKYSLEEILLNWMAEHPGAKVQFSIVEKRRMLDFSVRLEGEGTSVSSNPIKTSEEFGSNEFAGMILANLGISWMHQFTNGFNVVSTRIPWKKANPLKRILLAIVLAVASIFLFSFLPDAASDIYLNYAVLPLFDAFLAALSAAVGPLIFMTVAGGIISIGDPTQLGSIGKNLCFRWLGQLLLVSGISLVLMVCFFPIQGGVSSLKGEGGSDIIRLFTDIIPSNIVDPFSSGNTLQIIFMAIVVGVSALLLKNKVGVIVQAIEQFNLIIQQIMGGITGLLPVFVYLSLVKTGLSGQSFEFEKILKMILLYLAGILVYICYLLVSTKRKMKIPLKEIISAIFPNCAIAFATASTASVFEDCRHSLTKLGMDENLVDFGLPLGFVVYMPGFLIWLVLFGATGMETYSIPITIDKIVILVIVSLMVSIASPPIPGGAITCMAMLFTQLGIPAELLAIASVTDFLQDSVSTSLHVFGNEIQLLRAANDLNLMDEKKKTGSQKK
jgi:Na+/H+-dicarboxylate symporter